LRRVTIRPATEEDIPAVLDLWARERSPAAVTDDSAEALRGAIEAGALLIAEDGGAPVGTVIAGWDGWRGALWRLVVEPEHRRNGVGRALVEAGERRLRDLGAVRITVLVGRDEDDAGEFWAATGYEEDRKIRRFVRNL
jgi:ribosomal protein S18 acetylase RimI-like enzyme